MPKEVKPILSKLKSPSSSTGEDEPPSLTASMVSEFSEDERLDNESLKVEGL